MLRKCFSLASAVGLSGIVVWGGCSNDDEQTPGGTKGTPLPDAGSQSQDSGGAQDTGASDTGSAPGSAVTYGKCTAFSKCGGDLVGNWSVSGGCLSETTFAKGKEACPGLQEQNVVIKAQGTMNITATEITRKTTITVTGKVLLPKSCVKSAPCAFVGIGLTTPGAAPGGLSFDTATCVDAANNTCDCDVSDTLSDDATDSYTAADGTLKTLATAAVKERTYDYCVTGDKLTYMETTAGQPLKLTVEVTK